MARGAKPGERRGGRTAGTPNRATVEAVLDAERTLTEARNAKGTRKLGKEVLDDFMQLFAGMAAYYQPSPKNAPVQNPNADKVEFKEYAMMAVKTARYLTEFQSPKFRAVAVFAGDDEQGMPKNFPQMPVPTGKTMGALEAYQLLRDKNDIIDITPTVTTLPKTNGASQPKKRANGKANGS